MGDLAEFVHSIRVKNRLSQKEFAEKLGTSQSVVSHWERGTRKLSIEQLEKIAEVFNLNLRMLDLTAGLTQDEQDLLMLYNQFDADMKPKAMELLEMALFAQRYMRNDPRYKDLFDKDVNRINDLARKIDAANDQLDV